MSKLKTSFYEDDQMYKEDDLYHLLEEQDWVKEIRYATEFENMAYHVDLVVNHSLHKSYLIDVKQKSTVKDAIYIELKNVRGWLGSLFGGATHFAFERDDYFAIVHKVNLIYMKDWFKLKKGSGFYQLYSRKNTDELIVKVPFKDIEKLIEFKIDKTT